jgi:endonuclease G
LNFYFETKKYIFPVKLLPAILLAISVQITVARSVDYLPVPAKDLIIHSYYTLSYNEAYEQANWVYYSLTDSMILNGGEERSNKFKIDKLVASGSAKSSDYTKSGYDRGHLCPAADMGFSQTAMEESFLMSNISPQVPDFNRGIWKELETTIRKWAIKERHIIVVTGPIFKENNGTIGKEQVLVPGYFFKLIYDTTDEPKLIAFILPNAKSDRPLTDFSVSVNEVEKQTGFDFFSQLPDDVETRLETNIQLAGWFEGYTPEKTITVQPEPTETASSDFYFYLILFTIILLVVLFVSFRGNKRKRR